jgi:hypothetical protein
MNDRLVVVIAIIMFCGCHNSTEGLPVSADKKLAEPLTLKNFTGFQINDTVNIYLGDTLSNADQNIWITFDSLLQDSRCPVNVNCIWQGNAEVSIRFSNNRYIQQVRLNTFPDFQRQKAVFGYTISLIDVLPYPHTDSLYVEDDYSVKLTVKKVSE